MDLCDGIDFKRLERHAERFGCEEIYETALECGASTATLARLARRLRRIDDARKARKADWYRTDAGRLTQLPRWRLTPPQRRDLVDRMLENGDDDKTIADTVGMSRSGVRTARSRAAELAESAT